MAKATKSVRFNSASAHVIWNALPSTFVEFSSAGPSVGISNRPDTQFLLQEDDFAILQEDGFKLLKEQLE